MRCCDVSLSAGVSVAEFSFNTVRTSRSFLCNQLRDVTSVCSSYNLCLSGSTAEAACRMATAMRLRSGKGGRGAGSRKVFNDVIEVRFSTTGAADDERLSRVKMAEPVHFLLLINTRLQNAL